ncbi:MAG: sigma-54 dependent transcriptional regulator [Gammaproteobacteria bacterium]|nr:sigma-54 dependent transcriptional regulator [Gammaproteobacteria bacterium]MDP2141902.1 sigma-54 dependent transcriptional regulator [Gammaproteobacteria bacterium]MDP2347216.1 sigma-54 dependent transcriptional regulator [Gammaproteobacteria bacterium]
MTDSVLIVDDEPDIRELLEITLGRMSLITESAGNLAEAHELLQKKRFSLCLTDMRLPDGDGIHLVEHIQCQYNHMPVAVITAHGNTETAIRALKAGAFDFVSKPVDLQKLRDLVNSALKLSQHSTRTITPTPITIETTITGTSASIAALRQQIARLARSQAPVFITGESGSGKELAARSIHNQSARADAPFIGVNCGAIPAELMESELFGHVKGSFTGADKDKTGLFQAARGGTLFLDEVADLPLHMQVKLLRVIQEKSVRPVGSQTEIPTDVRILSASHKNLAEEVLRRNFRQDLYYRINVIELAVPSLRERKQDVPELTRQILLRIADENHIHPIPTLSDEALLALCEYPFPGNIRELENILQRAVTLCENNIVSLQNLDLHHSASAFSGVAAMIDSPTEQQTQTDSLFLAPGFSLEKHLDTIERKAIETALAETRWNKTAAAQRLGMTFRSLRYRMKRLGMG